MTTYSGTFTPPRSSHPIQNRDPLAEARDLLRSAARLPFVASHPETWLAKFSHQAEMARSAVRQHILKSARPDSPMNELARDEPRLQAVIDKQRAEHAQLVRQAELLCAEAQESPNVDIWRMIDLGEKAILLEMALARHHNRLVRLVYESANLELGGEAG
jgi:hypothetical protein